MKKGGSSSKNSTLYKAEDVARGFGFTESKNGIEYVRWRTINQYLREFGLSQDVAKDNFLPENMVFGKTQYINFC